MDIKKKYPKMDNSIYEDFVRENKLKLEGFWINENLSIMLISKKKIKMEELTNKVAYHFDTQDFRIIQIQYHFLIIFEF